MTTAFERLREEIYRYRRSDWLSRRIDAALREKDEFQRRFPLGTLSELSLRRFWGKGRRREDFCHWFIDATPSVAGHMQYGGLYVGVKSRNEEGRYIFSDYVEEFRKSNMGMSDELIFEKAIRRPLVGFLVSRGVEFTSEAQAIFGSTNLLKLLILYYPEEFVCVTDVRWLDRIIWAFSLRQSGKIAEKSRSVMEFFSSLKKEKEFKNLQGADFIAILEYHLGLGKWEKCLFREFLIDRERMSQTLAEHDVWTLRRFWTNLRGIMGLRGHLESAKVESVERAFRAGAKGVSKDDAVAYERLTKLYIAYRRANISKGEKRKNKLIESADKRLITLMKSAETAESVVDTLRESAKEHKVYWHYTVMSSLLYLLDGKSLRLSRGDSPTMNDQLECERLGDKEMWKRTYLTSFSHLEDESVAMWAVYGIPTNEGVRLGFSNEAMQDLIASIRKSSTFVLTNKDSKLKVPVQKENVVVEFADVLYGGNVLKDTSLPFDGYSFRGRWIQSDIARTHALDQDAKMTGFLKSMDWEYERETRLVIRVNDVPTQQDGEELLYLTVSFPPELLSKITYYVGPCLPEKLRVLFKEKIGNLVSKCGAGVDVQDSKYKDRLVLKK